MTKVSLVLTTFNSKELLKHTIESIKEQTYENIEIIIQDGLSTDGTLEIIKEYADENSNVNWVSEKDSGLYDAMNRGIKRATGDLIVCFNDLFATKDSVLDIVSTFEANPGVVGVHADLIYEENGKIIRDWKMGEGRIIDGWLPAHPTMFLKKEIYEKYGLYDTSYKCSADYEYMLRFLCDENNRLAYLPKLVVRMFYGGTSTSGISGYWTSVWESYKALKKNKVKRAGYIIFRRILKVIRQF